MGLTSDDVFITTDALPRCRLRAMPQGFELVCTRASGWELWFHAANGPGDDLVSSKLAAETPTTGVHGLKLEVGETVLCNSLKGARHA